MHLHRKACRILCATKLAQSTSQYYFVLQSLHKALHSTTLHYKACTKHFPVLLCTTKLAQGHVPSTTLYYKPCTKLFPVLRCTAKLAKSTFPVLLCTTKLAQSTFQVLLCTTKLAQSTSQYYFVLQSFHKARPNTTKLAQSPSTTLYYKACTKYFPSTTLY